MTNRKAHKVGFRPAEFAAAIGLSRTSFYAIPQELRPRAVKFGTAHVIIENPQAYLDRIAKAQLEGATSAAA